MRLIEPYIHRPEPAAHFDLELVHSPLEGIHALLETGKIGAQSGHITFEPQMIRSQIAHVGLQLLDLLAQEAEVDVVVGSHRLALRIV